MFLKQTLRKAPKGSGDVQELRYPTADAHLSPLWCTVESLLLFLPLPESGKHFTGGLSFHHHHYKLFRPVRVCSQPFRHHQDFPSLQREASGLAGQHRASLRVLFLFPYGLLRCRLRPSRASGQHRVSLTVLFLFPRGLSRKAARQKRRGRSHGRPATPAASPVTQLAAGGDRLAKTRT